MGFYIFDLDGTLCNIDHRLHHLEKSRWDLFFEACVDDEPVPDVINLFNDLVRDFHRVEIWSGRSDAVIRQTHEWLDKHLLQDMDIVDVDLKGAPSNYLTRMRQDGDFTPDDQLKKSWMKNHLKTGPKPTMIFDDRQRVVDMWREMGITCAQVAQWDELKKD